MAENTQEIFEMIPTQAAHIFLQKMYGWI